MSWNNTKNSHRSALVNSGGWELNFASRAKLGGEICRFRPTETQPEQYRDLWPLLDRMDGICARSIPEIWRDQLLDQASTNFMRTATAVSSFSSVTLLKSAPSAVHCDGRNSGFVVMTVAGRFTGGEFLLPEFAVSIDVGRGGVLICSTQKHWHANFRNVVGVRYSILGFFPAALKGNVAA
jgi:hypothetical protein